MNKKKQFQEQNENQEIQTKMTPKRPYTKPTFQSEPMFETAALQGCGRAADVNDFICSANGGTSS